MKITSNSIYYFFSTSAQAYAALLAILLTLILFRIQRLIDQRKEEIRKILEEFVEVTLENADFRSLRERLNLTQYWHQKDDTGRFNQLKKQIFNMDGSMVDAASQSGPPFFPQEADTDFLKTLWIRMFNAEALFVMAITARRNAMQAFLIGAILIASAILLTVLPSIASSDGLDSGVTLWGVGLLLPMHFIAGVYFLYRCAISFKNMTEIKI